jgi:hypothetical protein
VIFWRTHWAWSCDWEEWDAQYGPGRWVRRSTHYGDYASAFSEWDRVRALEPGRVRNVGINRRPVGAPRYFLRST